MIEPIQIEQQKLEAIWQKVERDRDARRALEKLRAKGFSPDHDTQLRIAEIPLLSKRRSKSRVLSAPRGSIRAVSSFFRELRKSLFDPYTNLEAKNDKAKWAVLMREGIESEFPELKSLPELLERIVAYQFVVTERNQQHHAIARLQLEVQSRTGDRHVSEIKDLLDAVFRAAGELFDTKPIFLDSIFLTTVNDREIAVRRTGHKRLIPR
jgi:hypothetical protein